MAGTTLSILFSLTRMTDVSVIITVYNMRATVERCVASVLAQSFRNFELIIVDDGSTDGSGALCDRLNGTDSRIRVIHTENHGVSAARKAGVAVSKGVWLMFVDADDTLPSDSLQLLIDRGAEDVDIVAGNARCFAPTGVHSLNREMSATMTGMEFADQLFRGGVSDKLSGSLVRRNLLDLGSWLTSKALTPSEDRVLLLRASLKARTVVTDNSIYVYEYRYDGKTDADDKAATEESELTADDWETFFDRLHHLFDTIEPLSESFFLFRLRQFYTGIILNRLKFNSKGEASRLKAEARNHQLRGHDKLIMRMLRDPIFRRFNADKFAPARSLGRIDLGILIYARNSRRSIMTAIKKALHVAPAGNVEVVVIDNASTDNTVDIIKSVRAINPRVHIVANSETLSVEECLLAGLRRSVAENVIFTTSRFVTRADGPQSLLSGDDLLPNAPAPDIFVGNAKLRSRLLNIPLRQHVTNNDDDSPLKRLLSQIDLIFQTDNIIYRRTAAEETLLRIMTDNEPDNTVTDDKETADKNAAINDPRLEFLKFNLATILANGRLVTASAQSTPMADFRDRHASAKSIKADYRLYCDAVVATLFILKKNALANEGNCRAIAEGLSRRLFDTLSLLLASPLFPTEKAKIWLESAFDHNAWRFLEPLLPDNIAVLYKANDTEAIINQALSSLHSRRFFFYPRRIL